MTEHTDRIEKQIELNAPTSSVWQALIDYRAFGEWFGVNLESPFIPGQVSQGQITEPGYEHIPWRAVIRDMEPEHLFSFTWHPYAINPSIDYSNETSTLVEFKLETIPKGTRLTLVESGFDRLPSNRHSEAFRMHEEGWSQQMKNIEHYLSTAHVS